MEIGIKVRIKVDTRIPVVHDRGFKVQIMVFRLSLYGAPDMSLSRVVGSVVATSKPRPPTQADTGFVEPPCATRSHEV